MQNDLDFLKGPLKNFSKKVPVYDDYPGINIQDLIRDLEPKVSPRREKEYSISRKDESVITIEKKVLEAKNIIDLSVKEIEKKNHANMAEASIKMKQSVEEFRSSMMGKFDNFLIDFKKTKEEEDSKSHQEILLKKLKSLEKDLEDIKNSPAPELHDFSKDIDLLRDSIAKVSKGIYEYGSSLFVSKNGAGAGFTQGINFKNTSSITVNVTQNGTQTDVSFDATGGSSELAATGSVNGSNTVFTFTSLPTYIISDGIELKAIDNNGGTNWTHVGTTVTMINPPVYSIYGR